jgi:N-carbamoyl-L-amino-acid hydrolase
MPADELRIDGQRLLDSLADMAKWGATPDGGCNRQAFTDADRAGRNSFVEWCSAAGCCVRVDPIGNIFARRPAAGSERGAIQRAVMSGSHLDTQATGGRYDGAYGVLAALEVVRTLNDAAIEAPKPFDIVVWSSEEGARFSPALLGSGVWSGSISLDHAYSRTDRAGTALRDELDRIGYLGRSVIEPRETEAYFELHIEQGPVLEARSTQIGVVTGIHGLHWYDIQIAGEACHASSAMVGRRDPVRALVNILDKLYGYATIDPSARMTFGAIEALPGARNTVPERVTVSVDVRHSTDERLEHLDRCIRETVSSESKALGLGATVSMQASNAVARFDRGCIDSVESAARKLRYSSMRLESAATHDAYHVSKVVPTSMIFIPSAGGLSHNPAEYSTPEDLVAGCNVLLHVVLSRLFESRPSGRGAI